MKYKKMKYSRSKLFAICIFLVTTIITAYAITLKMEGVASAIFSTGVTASTALYVNKQIQLRKEKEIK